jgi:hypothetical protein
LLNLCRMHLRIIYVSGISASGDGLSPIQPLSTNARHLVITTTYRASNSRIPNLHCWAQDTHPTLSSYQGRQQQRPLNRATRTVAQPSQRAGHIISRADGNYSAYLDARKMDSSSAATSALPARYRTPGPQQYISRQPGLSPLLGECNTNHCPSKGAPMDPYGYIHIAALQLPLLLPMVGHRYPPYPAAHHLLDGITQGSAGQS